MTTTGKPAVGVFDTETTGVNASTDRIVTVYVGALDDTGAVLYGQEWMIAPDGFVIPAEAAAIHGVTTEEALANGRPFHDVIGEVIAALEALNVPIAAHNAAYDCTMLAHEAARAGHPDPVALISGLQLLDTFILDKKIDPFRRGKRTLQAIAPLYDVTLSEEEAHGAAADAIASGRIALAMLQHPELRNMPFDELVTRQRGWAREQGASFQAYKKRTDPTFTLDMNWPLHESALALAPAEQVYVF